MRKAIFLLFFSLIVGSQTVPDEIIELSKLNPNYSNLIDRVGKTNVVPEIVGEDISIDDNSEDEIIVLNKSEIFGADYIKTAPKSISSTSDLPVPNEYIVALGDKLRIILTGGKKDSFVLTVGMDGVILFPEIGKINVFGDSMLEVRKKIENLVNMSFVGTDVFISIEELTAKKINIVGAVEKPGVYIVNPFSTLSSALAYAGGFQDYASLREITIIRGEEIRNFDLYDLLIYGDRTNDINIQQGDTILIKATKKFIRLSGSINRPYIYEYKENETINDMISYALGPTQSANLNNISITHLNKSLNILNVEEVSLDQNKILSEFYNPVEIEVFDIESSPELKIKVTGPLENQGYFDVPASNMLSELIKNFRFTDNINPFIAVVEDGSRTILFSLNDKATHNERVSSNSSIFFFDKNEKVLEDISLSENTRKLIEEYQLSINFKNEVLNFPYFGKANAGDIVNFMGLDLADIVVSQTSFIAPIKSISETGNLYELEIEASKFNFLNLRNLIDNTIEVTVEGEVNLPGKYTLNPGTTLKELYSMVDGVNKLADKKSVIFTRESIKQRNIQSIENAQTLLREKIVTSSEDDVNSNLLLMLEQDINEDALGRISGNLYPGAVGNDSFLLEDGDSIFIPKKISTITVLGEVLNPSSFIYEPNMTLKNVIANVGGYTQSALKKGVYVIRSNGVVENRSSAFTGDLKILPGDTIIVPVDFRSQESLVTLLTPITSILSNLAFSAAAIDNLKR